MSTHQAAYATHLDEWLPSRSEHHERNVHVEALGRGNALPFGCWAACFRCVVEAS